MEFQTYQLARHWNASPEGREDVGHGGLVVRLVVASTSGECGDCVVGDWCLHCRSFGVIIRTMVFKFKDNCLISIGEPDLYTFTEIRVREYTYISNGYICTC
jgi:hypothetical protein